MFNLKKLSLLLILIIQILFTNFNVYAYNSDIADTASKFARFEPEISIIADDLNSYINQIFEYNPTLEFYYKGYSASSTLTYNSVKFIYTNQDIPQNDISYAKSEDELYKILANNLLYCKKNIYIITDKNFNLSNTISKITSNEPIVAMGYKGFQSASTTSEITNNACYKISVDYSVDTKELLNYKAISENVAMDIVSQNVCKSMPDYQKEKIIHDYLVKNTEYSDEDGELAYMAYDALINGKGVCSAYATSIKIMLDLMNIENYYVTGTGTNSNGTENHGWNIVKIGNSYYNLDVTWDDPITPYGFGTTRYDYFNITDSEMAKNHTWDSTNLPECNSTEYCYDNVKKAIRNDDKNYSDYYTRDDFVSVFDKYTIDNTDNTTESTTYTITTHKPTTNVNIIINDITDWLYSLDNTELTLLVIVVLLLLIKIFK